MTTDLTPPYALEVVTYRLNDGADAEAFLERNRTVGRDFTSAQPGFLRREIGRDADGGWVILVCWKTADDARNSISRIDTLPDIVKAYMADIDRATLSRAIYEVV